MGALKKPPISQVELSYHKKSSRSSIFLAFFQEIWHGIMVRPVYGKNAGENETKRNGSTSIKARILKKQAKGGLYGRQRNHFTPEKRRPKCTVTHHFTIRRICCRRCMSSARCVFLSRGCGRACLRRICRPVAQPSQAQNRPYPRMARRDRPQPWEGFFAQAVTLDRRRGGSYHCRGR